MFHGIVGGARGMCLVISTHPPSADLESLEITVVTSHGTVQRYPVPYVEGVQWERLNDGVSE